MPSVEKVGSNFLDSVFSTPYAAYITNLIKRVHSPPMLVPTLFEKQFKALALSTGIDAETYLIMACKDWFEVSAPTYQPTVCKISKRKLAPVLSLVPMRA